jgi:hypothetical protein
VSDQPQAVDPRERRRRAIREWFTIHAYQLPGYGPIYRWLNRSMHARGWCVARRHGPLEPGGGYVWRCDWCGR